MINLKKFKALKLRTAFSFTCSSKIHMLSLHISELVIGEDFLNFVLSTNEFLLPRSFRQNPDSKAGINNLFELSGINRKVTFFSCKVLVNAVPFLVNKRNSATKKLSKVNMVYLLKLSKDNHKVLITKLNSIC